MRRDEFTGAPALLVDRRRHMTDESWPGYLMRLANVNKISNVTQLSRLLGMTTQQLLVCEPSTALVQLGIRVDSRPSEVPLERENARLRTNVPSSGRSLRSRVCPQCFAEDGREPYIRAAWDLPMEIACTKHRVLLLDRCACGKEIEALRPSMTHCSCGASFAKQVTKPADAWTQTLRVVFKESYGGQSYEAFARATALSQYAARACKWLAASAQDHGGSRPRRIQDPAGFLSMDTALAMRPFLDEWPCRTIASVIPEINDSRRDTYGHLIARLGAAHFAEMRRVVAGVKANLKRAAAHGARDEPSAGDLDPDRVMGIKALMRATGHSHGTLLRCIDDGAIPGATYWEDPQTRTRRFNIPCDSYLTIARMFERTIGLDEAAQRVGCDADAMRGLVRSGAIPSSRLITTTMGEGGERVCPAGVTAFANELIERATFARGANLERVYFSWWVPPPYGRRRSKRWPLLLRGIRTGALTLHKATRTPESLNELFLLEGDLKRWIKSSRSEES